VFLYFVHFVTNRGAAKMSGSIAGFLSTGYSSPCKPPATGHQANIEMFPEFFKLLLYFSPIRLLKVTPVAPSLPAIQFVIICNFQEPHHYFDRRASCLFGIRCEWTNVFANTQASDNCRRSGTLGVQSTWCLALMLYLS
jgi:hypothetical protein